MGYADPTGEIAHIAVVGLPVRHTGSTKGRKRCPESMTQGGASSYARQSDPKGLCNVPGPFVAGAGYPVARGYQYDGYQLDEAAGNSGFNLADFGKQLALGFVLGGMSSTAFYGAGKAVDAVRDSVRVSEESGATQIIRNRYPEEPQVGRDIGYTIENGRVYVANGVQKVDFVITMDGNLHIGSGHSYLANRADVQAAGTMKINSQGYVRAITNASGHYAPVVEQLK